MFHEVGQLEMLQTAKVSVIWRLALDIFYLHRKLGDSRFSRSGDMIAASKLQMGYVTLTMTF